MLNLNLTPELSEKYKPKLELIEALWKWGNINIEWELDDDMLDSIIMYYSLLWKLKELKPKDWKDWEKWESIKWDKGDKGDKGDKWIDGKNWTNGKNWLDGKNGLNWLDWQDWTWLEFMWDWTRLWIRKEWEENRDYRELKGKWLFWWWWGNVNKEDLLNKSTTLTAWNHNIHNTYKTYYCDTTAWNVVITITKKWFLKDEWFYIKRISTDNNILSIQPAEWLIESETIVEIDDNTWFYFSFDWTDYQSLTY